MEGQGLSRVWASAWRDELVLRVSGGDLRRNSLVENVIIQSESKLGVFAKLS